MNDCPFCDYAGPSKIIRDYGSVYVIEPIDPVTEGHVLVIPKRHLMDAMEDSNHTGFVFAFAVAYAKEVGIGPCNFITSVGSSATQTIWHLHVHVVPRRPDDGLQLPWGLP